MDINTYKSFLDLIKTIELKYEKLEENQAADFNIFKILKLTSYEVRTHSAFLANLLNSSGKHNQGTKFLELFTLSCLNQEVSDVEEYQIFVEKNTAYGNIDILLQKEDSIIVIENKIFAGDQENQLERYNNYALETYSKEQIHLVYLTLTGYDPSDYSLGKSLTTEDVTCLSYQYDIKRWVELCIKEVALLPNVREVLFQYHGLIELLTGREISKEFTMELTKLLYQNNYHDLINPLEDAILEFKIALQYEFWKSLRKELENRRLFKNFTETVSEDTVRRYYEKKSQNTYYGLATKVQEIDEDHDLVVRIEIHNSIYYGLRVVKNNYSGGVCKEKSFDDLVLRLEATPTYGKDFKRTNWWLGYRYFDQDLDFRQMNNDTYSILASQLKRGNAVVKLSDEIQTFLEEFENHK